MQASDFLTTTKDDIMLYATVLSALCTLGVFALELRKSAEKKRLNVQDSMVPAIEITATMKRVGYLAAIAAAFLFGIHHVLAKDLVIEQGALHTVSIRNFIGGLILIIFGSMLNRFEETPKEKFFDFKTVAVLIGSTGANVCYALALTSLSATAASALYKLNPIYVFFILLWLNPNALKKIKWYEALVATVMVSCGAIVSINGNLSLELSDSINISSGIMLMIFAGLLWSIQNIYMKREGYDPGFSSGKIIYVGKILFTSSVVVGLVAKIAEPSSSYAGITSFSNISLGIIWGVTFILTFEAVNRIGALTTTALASFEVLFTGVIESLISILKLTWGLLIGSMLILLGNISLSRQDIKLSSSKSVDENT